MSHSVVIIGGGFSGSLTALHLAADHKHREPLTISLIDPRGTFGPGLAYTTPSDRFKLNVRTKAMGAFPDDPEGFLRWLRERDPQATPGDFAPRNRYGEYLTELVANAAETGGPHTLNRVTDEVEDVGLNPTTNSFTVLLKSGREIQADACVLAIGNLLRSEMTPGTEGSNFRAPYVPTSYEGIASLSDLLIVGSSLTAVDVILESEARGFRGSYTVVSRNGRFPLAHEELSAHAELPTAWEECASARTLVRIIRTESRRLGSSQPVFEAMRPKIQAMWRNLPLPERSRFLRHARPVWEIHRHRIPAPHLETLRGLIRSGRLSLIAGRIVETTRVASGISVLIRRRGAVIPEPPKNFDAAFMCIGPEGDLSKITMPLVKNLLRRGLLTPGPLNLGARCALEQKEGCPPFFVIGPMQREDLWEITAVRELREEAYLTAQKVLKSLRAGN